MRDTLLMISFALAFTAALVGVAVVAQEKKETPPEVTPRLLDCDPEFFADRAVRVRTQGCQPISPSEWGYRKQSDQPPVVVLRMKKPADTLPELVTGTCRGRLNGIVVVDGCR